jgi:hypothetical protein
MRFATLDEARFSKKESTKKAEACRNLSACSKWKKWFPESGVSAL